MPVNVPVQEQINLSSGILTRAYERYMAGERLTVEERSAVNKAIGDPVINIDPNETGRDRYSIRGGSDNIFAPLLPDPDPDPSTSPSTTPTSEPSTDSTGSTDGSDPTPTSSGSASEDVGRGSGSTPAPPQEPTVRPTSSSGSGRTRAIVLAVLAIGAAVAVGWS